MNGLIFSLAPLGGLATALPAMTTAATDPFGTAAADDARAGPACAPDAARGAILGAEPDLERDDGYLFL